MATVINNPPGNTDNSGGGAGAVILGLVIIVLVILFFVYGLPRLRGGGPTNITVPSTINVNTGGSGQ